MTPARTAAPTPAPMSVPREVTLPFDGMCARTGKLLPAGSVASFIPGEGMVDPSAA
jgi:hypothetical protein